MKCCICLNCLICKDEESDKTLSITKCGHLFHTDCIEKFFLAASLNIPACPLCRKPIRKNEEIRFSLEFECDCEPFPIIHNTPTAPIVDDDYFDCLSQYKIKDISDIQSKTEILSEMLMRAMSKTGELVTNLLKLAILTLNEYTKLLSEQTKKISQLEELLEAREPSSSSKPNITIKKVNKLINKFSGLSIKKLQNKPKNNAQNSEIYQDLELQLAVYKSFVEQHLDLSIEDIIYDDSSSIVSKCSDLKISDN